MRRPLNGTVRAAAQGNDAAWCLIAGMYHDGDGVEKDDAEALKGFVKAAELGNTDAECRLGGMYLSGDGVLRITRRR